MDEEKAKQILKGVFLGAGILGVIFCGTFAVLYGIKMGEVSELECEAIRGDDGNGNPLETEDAAEKWSFVMRFGFGIWLANTFVALLITSAAFSPAAGAMGALLGSCCISIPNTVQVVYLGVYRWSWWGKACSE